MIRNMMQRVKTSPGLLWLLAIMVLAAALRLALVHTPFDRDEGQYAAIAQEILRGGIPYRDAIEIKPPGTFYLYAAAIALFGATIEGVRIFTLLYTLLTIYSVYYFAKRLGGERAGLWGALIFGFFSSSPLFQGLSNSEMFLILPLTAGSCLFLAWLDNNQPGTLALAGLCAACALLIKQVALPLVALQLLLIPFHRYRNRLCAAIAGDAAVFLLPLFVCAGVTAAYFSAHHALDDLLYWTITFPRQYRDVDINGSSLFFVLRYLRPALLVPLLAGIPTAVWLAASRRDLQGCLPLLLISAAFCGVVLPGKYFPHYFIMVLPFLSSASGIGLGQIMSMGWKAALPAALVLAVAGGDFVRKSYKFYTVYSPEKVSVATYGSTLFMNSARVAGYLKERTRPDDFIFQWGFEPEIYFLADRRFPNPWLVSFLPGWSQNPARAVAALRSSLMERKPAYIVVQPEWAEYDGYQELQYYLQNYCRKETTIGYAEIFRCAHD